MRCLSFQFGTTVLRSLLRDPGSNLTPVVPEKSHVGLCRESHGVRWSMPTASAYQQGRLEAVSVDWLRLDGALSEEYIVRVGRQGPCKCGSEAGIAPFSNKLALMRREPSPRKQLRDAYRTAPAVSSLHYLIIWQHRRYELRPPTPSRPS